MMKNNNDVSFMVSFPFLSGEGRRSLRSKCEFYPPFDIYKSYLFEIQLLLAWLGIKNVREAIVLSQPSNEDA